MHGFGIFEKLYQRLAAGAKLFVINVHGAVKHVLSNARSPDGAHRFFAIQKIIKNMAVCLAIF